MRHLVLLALLLLASPVFADAIRVIDGDTIAIGRERIRLSGIDAPETEQAKCRSERRAGLAAKARVQDLIGSSSVTLDRVGRDIYGRTLAVVYVDGIDLGALLVAEGHARPYGGRRKPWC